jgi:hypothetical protein
MTLKNQIINDKLMKQLNKEIKTAKKELDFIMKSIKSMTIKTRSRTAKKK